MEIRVSGYCPHKKGKRFISVTYAVFFSCGDVNPQYKRMSFKCADGNECNYWKVDNGDGCPIFKSAPKDALPSQR